MVESIAQTVAAAAEPAGLPRQEGAGRLVLSRAELLTALEELQGFAGEYHRVLETVSDGEGWHDEALARIRAQRERPAPVHSPAESMHAAAGLFRFLMRRSRQEQFNFRVPTRIGVIPEADDPELAEWSERLGHVGEALEGWVAAVPALAAYEPARAEPRMQRLLPALAAFLKALVRQDWHDLALIMTHINLITTAADSHEVVGRIATIARDIYNSLNEFSEFVGVEAISHSTEELPDAVDKLRSVISKVEQAVNTNLDRLEALNAQAAQTRKWLEDAEATVGACDGEMTRLRDIHPELEEGLWAVQTILREEIGGRLARLETRSEEHAQVYMTMIANQSFQDLTGQTLKKVIAFIETMQFKLLTLLPNYRERGAAPAGGRNGGAAPAEETREAPVQSQDQVDQMLADLGF